MRSIFAVAALAALAVAVAVPPHLKYVEEVNSKPVGWTAGRNTNFDDWTLEDIKYTMGVKGEIAPDPKLPTATFTAEEIAAVPASFDSRTQWPGCIGPILDQARCGSCWAFGAAESISDRMCISGKTEGNKFVQLAPGDVAFCDTFFQNGCQGGQPSAAWQWAQSTGIVTEACSPYLVSEGGPMPTCARSAEPCMPNTFVQTPACNQTCHNGASYSGDKHMLSNVYNVGSNADAMAAELVKNGPFEVAMTVYEDFLAYKSGVYSHQSGQELGGHAIKVIGFGTEGGQDYWLVQNSWTTAWGAAGYFKIAKGTDECGIEDSPVAGTF